MKLNCDETALRLRRGGVFAALILTTMLFAARTGAQTQPAEQKAVEPKPSPEIYQTYYLTNATQQNEINDIQTDLRNMFPRVRIYSVQSQNAISIRGSVEDLALAQKMLAELDVPRKIYRLTYTITEMDGGKRTSGDHFSLIVAAGGRAVLKQGNRVPIITGTHDVEAAKQGEQVQYVDVGLNIEASLDGERLLTKVEQTGLSEERAGVSAHDPVIRQTVLDGVSILTLGKAVVLGSFDVPGSTRHEEVEVEAELVR